MSQREPVFDDVEVPLDIPVDDDTEDDWDEDRIDNIGQNGNNGDHYG